MFWVLIWPLVGFMMYSMRRNRGWRRSGRDRDGHEFDPEPLLREIESQREQIEEMSARLAELENRADFTERMLATPKEVVNR